MKSFVFSSVSAALILLGAGCMQNGQFGIRGQGPSVERKVNINRIKGISLAGSAKVYLTQGPVQEVRIEGQENIIDNLSLEVEGEIWKIDNNRPVWQSDPLKIHITMETLRLIRISGSGNVELTNHFKTGKDMEIRLSGSGRVDLNIEASDINANISGAGDLFLKGTADNMDLSISGSGNIKGYDLEAKEVSARITGSGGMEIGVTEKLDAHVTGSGSIYYKGNPRVNTSITGSGSVRSR